MSNSCSKTTIRHIHAFFIRNHFIRSLHIECLNIYRTYTTKGKFYKEELLNLKDAGSIDLQQKPVQIVCYACVKSFVLHRSYVTAKVSKIQYFNVLHVSAPFLWHEL